MNFGELKTEFSQEAPDSPATATQQGIWANAGAKHIARLLNLFPTSGSINLTSGTREYDLITSFTTFLKLDKEAGVFYYNGSDYTQLAIRTLGWLNTYLPAWRNDSNDEPRAVYKRGKYLGTYPTSASNVTSGLLVHYFAMPTAMASSTSDPFDSRTDLVDLHEGIILYMLWRAKRALGEYQQAEIHRKDFVKFIAEAEIWVHDDNVDFNEPFRPYHKAPTISVADPNYWGVE